MNPNIRRRLLYVFILFLLLTGTGGVAFRFFPQDKSKLPTSTENGMAQKKQAEPSTASSSGKAPKLKFEVIGSWKYDEKKHGPIPEAVKQLDEKEVEATGFMMPISETRKIKRFILLQNLWGCCFGQAPEVNHIIIVDMINGKTTEFSPDPVEVTGKFKILETREDGFLVSIYHMEANKIVFK